MRYLLIAAATALFSTPAQAEPLWQSLQHGATVSDVLAAFPAAKKDQANSDAAKSMYRLLDFPSAGMWVYFTFRSGLDEVKVYGQGADRFAQVLATLSNKYGKPASSSQTGKTSQTVWTKGSTTITAVLEKEITVEGFVLNDRFTVTYQEAAATRAATTANLDKGL